MNWVVKCQMPNSRRMIQECCVEMAELGGNREQNNFVPGQEEPQIQMPESQTEVVIEDWVGVHSLKKLPDSFESQEPSTTNFFIRVRCIREQRTTKVGFFSKNRMTILFRPPDPAANKTGGLKEFFEELPKYDRKPRPPPKIILLDAKDSSRLKPSFKKVLKVFLPGMKIKMDPENFPDEKTVNEIYKEMNNENSKKDQSLFVFIGAESFEQIKSFLPRGNSCLSFCQFFATTSSETFNWESEELKNWTIEKLLLMDKELIVFDWEGVHSASKIPGSFQPVPEFTGRAEIMNNLVQRFQNEPPATSTVQRFHSDGCRCRSYKTTKTCLFPPPAPPPARATLTLISGVRGNGKTEMVKKLLSTHPQLFAKVVLTDALNDYYGYHLRYSFKIMHYSLGIYSEKQIEGATLSGKIASLHSEITKDLQDNQRFLFVFDAAESLQQIKNYLPKNCDNNKAFCHVLLTSASRDWQKKEDVKFYRDNGYDFQEIPLFDGLSLDETHEFCSKVLQHNGILYLKNDLERSISELHKLTGGFPLALQNIPFFISESSRRNPEWTPKLHMLNCLSRHIQDFVGHRFTWDMISADCAREPKLLFQIMCLLNPEHLELDMICYFYLEHKNPFKPPPQKYEPDQVKEVEGLLRDLELAAIIQIDRTFDADGQDPVQIRVRIPAFLKKLVRNFVTYPDDLYRFLSGAETCSWTRPLDVPLLLPLILRLNESYSRFHGYQNQFLIRCIQHHFEFWKNPPQDGEIYGEEEQQQRPQTDYETEKEKIKKLLNENPDFKNAFGDFSQVENPGFLLPVLSLILFVADVGSDLNNAIIIFKAGYISYFCLALFLVVFPFSLLCKLHKIDRTKYKEMMKPHQRLSWPDHLKALTGTFGSYLWRLWHTWKFRRETDDLERGFLFERLCVLEANAEYHGIAEAFMESLPQLLLQFSLYLLSYTQGHSKLRKIMRGSLIPFELSLAVGLLSFGLALTKLESVYFGWNMELFGINLLGYRSLHFLLNALHTATLVFCSGIVSVVFSWFTFFISLVLCLSATAWIHSETEYSGWMLPNLEIFQSRNFFWFCGKERMLTFFASFHPAYVKNLGKLESMSKPEFVSSRLGHDLLFLQRRPKNRDIVFLFVFFSSILISAFTAVYFTFLESRFPIQIDEDSAIARYVFAFPVLQKYSHYFILWLPLVFVLQVLRQVLTNFYLKYSKIPPITEDYILNDPEGILRYPEDSGLPISIGWVQKRLYYRTRAGHFAALHKTVGRDHLSVFSQTWTQVKQAVNKFNSRNFKTKVKSFLLLFFKLICKMVYFLFIAGLLCLVPFNMTLLTFYSPTLSTSSELNNNYTSLIQEI